MFKRIGLNAIALTDHDSVKGLPEAIRAAKNLDMKFVPGVEITCNFDNLEIEIVALGVDFGTIDKCLHKRDT